MPSRKARITPALHRAIEMKIAYSYLPEVSPESEDHQQSVYRRSECCGIFLVKRLMKSCSYITMFFQAPLRAAKGTQMPREIVFTAKAARPPTVYSQAVKAAGLVFVPALLEST